jgi:GLPGLI family protein
LSSGPDAFNGLPGMILKVDINKQEFVYLATEISKTVNLKDLKAPTKGKKVTRQDFAKLQKELFGNQSGPVRIVTN